MSRASVRSVRVLPSRSNSRSCSTRSSFGCSSSGISPTSSRNTVPWLASSKRPMRWLMAPVKAPLSWPNSSLSSRPVGIAAQLSFTNAPIAPRAQLMDGARDQLLAGAGLARDEHGRIGRRDGLDLLQHAPQRGAAADDVLEQLVAADLVLEVELLAARAARSAPRCARRTTRCCTAMAIWPAMRVSSANCSGENASAIERARGRACRSRLAAVVSGTEQDEQRAELDAAAASRDSRRARRRVKMRGSPRQEHQPGGRRVERYVSTQRARRMPASSRRARRRRACAARASRGSKSDSAATSALQHAPQRRRQRRNSARVSRCVTTALVTSRSRPSSSRSRCRGGLLLANRVDAAARSRARPRPARRRAPSARCRRACRRRDRASRR